MTDSISIKLKPGAAILMALALITTTFAGVSYADPADDGTGSGAGSTGNNTTVFMDYQLLTLDVDQAEDPTAFGVMSVTVHIYDDENFSVHYGPEEMSEEMNANQMTNHYFDFDMTLFFVGNDTLGPMAGEGVWYHVDANITDEYQQYVGTAHTDICMDNGSVCELDMVDNNTDSWEEEMFDEVDADGDGAINGTELINHENLMRSENNESPMNTSEETELLDAMADYDTGFTSADGNDTEDANDGMLEFNEFLDFYNGYILGDYETVEAMLDETGVLTVMIHNDDGNIAYVQIMIMDMYQNDLINETHFPADSSDLTNGFDDWTSPDCCADSGMYMILVHLYDENNSMIGMEYLTVGEMPTEEESMFLMFDNDGNGNISIDEYFALIEGSNNETIDEQTKSMITNLFMGEDVDGDQELNMDEFSSFLEAMINMGEGGEGEYSEMEMMMMMLDENQDGNITLSEILVMVEENQSDASQMTTFYTNMFNNEDVDGNALLDASEFAVFFRVLVELDGEDCYEVMVGDAFMVEGEFEDEEGNYTDYMVGDTAPSNGTYCVQTGMDSDGFLFMHDTNGDDQLSLTEILAAISDENSTSMDLMIIAWVFESYDDDSDQLLDQNELGEFIDRMDNEYDYQPTPVQMMDLIDTDGDGSVSIDEIVLWISAEDEEPMSEIEKEYLGIMFMMFDADTNAMLNPSEFPDFYYAMQSQDHDNGGDDGGEANMVCYDKVNHIVVGGFTDATSCETAGHLWTDMSQSSGGDDQNNTDTEDEGDDIQFESLDVWFEQWDNDNIELVFVELAVVDNAEDIARLSMMADSMYGNNDSVLNVSEVEMLMALYAMNLDIDDISEGMTLDGQNGTAVDFWVEIDGLLEGDDVVFIRVGTVIEFPTTAYDTSTTHTFVVNHSDDSEEERMQESNGDETCENNVRVHNSDAWEISSVITTGNEIVFTYEDTNDMWIGGNDNCHSSGIITFNLVKVENGTMPAEEDDDWTWEDEEMNLLPICDWFYSVTFADGAGTNMSDKGVDEAESGDRIIVLVDNAAYEFAMYCWDPEGGNMTVDISSSFANDTSNTSMGFAWSRMSFKLPAGTGGNFSVDIAWTDGYHTGNGTLTVIATGDGSTGDISEVEADSEGIPGFTAALGVVAMLGAALIAGRRNEA